MKWFSISGVIDELRKVRWPKLGELISQTGTVLLFTVSFAAFFMLCELVAATFIKSVGM